MNQESYMKRLEEMLKAFPNIVVQFSRTELPENHWEMDVKVITRDFPIPLLERGLIYVNKDFKDGETPPIFEAQDELAEMIINDLEKILLNAAKKSAIDKGTETNNKIFGEVSVFSSIGETFSYTPKSED